MLKFVTSNLSKNVLDSLNKNQGYNAKDIFKAGKNAKLPKTTEKNQVNVDLERYKEEANASLKKIRELKNEVALISKQIDRHHIKTEEIKKELNHATDEKRNDIQLRVAEMELVYSNLNTKRDAIKLQIENEEIFYKKICELDRFSQGAHNNQHEVAENNPTQHLNDHENEVVATTIKPSAINTVIENKPLEQTVAPPLIHDLLGSSLFNRKKLNSQQSEVSSPVPEETVSTVSNPSFTDTQRMVNGNTAGATRMDLKHELTDALAKRKAKQDSRLAQIQELDSLMDSIAFQAAELQELDSSVNSIELQEGELANGTGKIWGLAPIPEGRESIVTEEPDSSFFKRKTKTASLLEFEREEKLSNLNHS